MIILNNYLYSCENCLQINRGQTCEHYEQKGLLSVERTSVKMSKSRGLKGVKGAEDIQGKYRLIIDSIPQVKKIYIFNKHNDEEILFHKCLGVNVKADIGSCAYDLDPSSLSVKICSGKEYLDRQFVVPYGKGNYIYDHSKIHLNFQPKSNHQQTNMNYNTGNNEMIPTSSKTENYSYFNPNSSVQEPIVIRPLSIKANFKLQFPQQSHLDMKQNNLDCLASNGSNDKSLMGDFNTSYGSNEIIDYSFSFGDGSHQLGDSVLKFNTFIHSQSQHPLAKELNQNSSDSSAHSIRIQLDSTELNNDIISSYNQDKGFNTDPNQMVSSGLKIAGSPLRFATENAANKSMNVHVNSATPSKIINLETLLKSMDQEMSTKKRKALD